jgi:hypothetical protein
MSQHRFHRIIAVFAGAAALFGVQQGLGAQFYLAFGAGLLAYIAVLLGLTLLLGSGRAAK